MAKINELKQGTGAAAAQSIEERAEGLNTLFTDLLIPFVRQINEAAINAQAEE